MVDSTIRLRVGARGSQLSLRQTGLALDRLRALLPTIAFELIPFSSPGDEDRQTDLRISDPDFFTRYLDDAVRRGEVDFAVHSAKDLPDPVPADLDWCWLPWAEDRRDVVVLRPGETAAELPPRPVIGVSSDRREAWCRERWPAGIQRPIRGNIEHRLAQLDAGDFDVVLIAGCALTRLGLEARITEWIPLTELPTPIAQGYLAMTFRPDDARMRKLRALLVKSVVLASAGPGDPGLCPQATVDALRRADLCLYDALAPTELLAHLPAGAEAVFVGKRGATYSVGKDELEAMLVDGCRRGQRVVRLKGGDAGIFARLAEETEALAAHGLPFRVIAGVSSLQAATTSTGLLLTRKGVSRGFCVVTPEQLGDQGPAVGLENRQALPLVLFMAVKRIRETVAELRTEGRPADEPAAMVFGASTSDETILHGTLATIADQVETYTGDAPGLLIVGAVADAAYRFRTADFPLGGRRVLLTCSARLMDKAMATVHELGGRPIPLPLIELVPERAALTAIRRLAEFDWLVLTSPSAVDCLVGLLREAGVDWRRVPRLLVCGPGTVAALANHGLTEVHSPADSFSAEGMIRAAANLIAAGDRVLRLRSDLAGDEVAQALTALGATVTDVVLYRNVRVTHPRLPAAEAIFLASASAVDSFVGQWGAAALGELVSVAIGEPTARRLAAHGLTPTLVAPEATVAASLHALAGYLTALALV